MWDEQGINKSPIAAVDAVATVAIALAPSPPPPQKDYFYEVAW